MGFRTTPATEGRSPLPVWLIYGLRPLALFISFATLILGGIILSDAEFDAPSMAVAVGVLTIVGFAYIYATLFITNITQFHNTIAVFAIDVLLWVLWLVTMSISARRLAQYRKATRGISTLLGGDAFTGIRDKLAGIVALSVINYIILTIIMSYGIIEITKANNSCSPTEKPDPTPAGPPAGGANTEMESVSPEYNPTSAPQTAPYPTGGGNMPAAPNV